MRTIPALRFFGALAVLQCASAQTFFPPPPSHPGNPTTANRALLGKALFWDEQLSSSRTMACGTCHIFGSGGADPRSGSATHPGPDATFGTADDIHGSPGVVRQDAAGARVGDPLFQVRPQSTGRRAPPVINAAYESELFWDGRAANAFTDPVSGLVTLPYNAALESQASGPPVSDVEMSHMGRSWTDIAADLTGRQPLALADQIPANLQAYIGAQNYTQLFDAEFGPGGVTPERIIFAIAAYERTLIADQSPVDLYLNGLGTLSAQELNGFNLFGQFCATCHLDAVSNGPPGLNDYRVLGVRPPNEDTGRFAVTGLPVHMGSFKVPQLRNVALRAPYMHTGGLATLNDVMLFYNRGGDFGPGIDIEVQLLAGQLGGIERADIIAFMNALTDPRVQLEQAPFDRPRLMSESPRAPYAFGLGTAGTGGFVPEIASYEPAFVGNQKFALGLQGALPGAAHFFVLDFAGSTTPLPVLGQNMYLSLLDPRLFFTGLTQGTAPGKGWSSIVLPLPADPLLVGLPLYGQWLIGDAGGPNSLSSSNAFTTTIF
ncbi:MAG: cytochrome-c peroxidase [Planctomycetota bacterium]